LLGDWRKVLFPGTVTILLSGLAVVHLLRPSARLPMTGGRRTLWFYVTLGIWALWLSFGPDAGLYRWMYDSIPVFTWLRSPARFGVMVTLALVVLAAAVVARIAERLTPGRVRAFGTALVFFAMVEAYVGPIYQVDREPLSEVYRRLAALPSRPVAEFPYFTDSMERHRHTEYMLAATYHWRPLVNGSSDHTPSEAFADGLALAEFPRRGAWPVLERRGVHYVVVHWGRFEPGTAPVDEVAELVQRGVLHLLADDADSSLYQIVKWPEDLLAPAQHVMGH
jgi:hypothetical protein